MRSDLVEIVKIVQNTNQYGFTENVSYLMGAVQRHEVIKTFLGAALTEVVNRQIKMHELYCAGETGLLLLPELPYQNKDEWKIIEKYRTDTWH